MEAAQSVKNAPFSEGESFKQDLHAITLPQPHYKKDEKNGGDDKQMDFKSFTQLAGRLSTHLPTCENLETCAESAIRQ